jgi:hypothetical protein
MCGDNQRPEFISLGEFDPEPERSPEPCSMCGKPDTRQRIYLRRVTTKREVAA